MLGDVAVMVHPEDERYAHLIGKTVTLPLDRPRNPYHRRRLCRSRIRHRRASRSRRRTTSTTMQVGQRHKLPQINILTLDAKINDNAPAKYRGLDRFEARKQVVADLEAQGLLANRSSRTGSWCRAATAPASSSSRC